MSKENIMVITTFIALVIAFQKFGDAIENSSLRLPK
jgi:hypothetical protein